MYYLAAGRVAVRYPFRAALPRFGSGHQASLLSPPTQATPLRPTYIRPLSLTLWQHFTPALPASNSLQHVRARHHEPQPTPLPAQGRRRTRWWRWKERRQLRKQRRKVRLQQQWFEVWGKLRFQRQLRVRRQRRKQRRYRTGVWINGRTLERRVVRFGNHEGRLDSCRTALRGSIVWRCNPRSGVWNTVRTALISM